MSYRIIGYNSKKNDPKVFKLGIVNNLRISYKGYGFRSKGQRTTRSQGQKVQTHIEGDRVAGVSLLL